MTKRKPKTPTLSTWVKEKVDDWQVTGGDMNAPKIADHLVNEVPLMLVVHDARTAIYRHVNAALRARYNASVPQPDGTRRYMQVELLGLDDLLDSCLADRQSQQQYLAKIVHKVSAWVAAHPDEGLSVDDVLAMVEDRFQETPAG